MTINFYYLYILKIKPKAGGELFLKLSIAVVAKCSLPKISRPPPGTQASLPYLWKHEVTDCNECHTRQVIASKGTDRAVTPLVRSQSTM